MAKNQRNLPGPSVRDPSTIDTLIYNEASGARKSINVGPHLLPLGNGASGYTTNATTATILPKMGCNLAIYNNSSSVAAITLGEDNTVTAQAAGAIQAGTQHVGIACPPNCWTYLSCGVQNWVIASSASLLVYLIDDETYIRVETTT